VGELVRYTARAVVPPDRRVELAIEEGLPMIRGRHDALQRALANVLLNAVDACDAGGTVRVDCERSRLNGSQAVLVRVRDTGAGIPAERIETIWEPYVTSKPGGTGLGLAIARQTILAHHGTVAADSVPGSGTEIRFMLPVVSAGMDQPETEAVSIAGSSERHLGGM
jgi:signal transduction histidine kinase